MVFDSYLCWPRTKAGEKVWQKCPEGVRGLDNESKYTHYEIEATLISNIFETGQNFRKIKQSTGVFFKKIEKISNNSNTYKQQ